ncbi:hypothetical protein [Alloscardovia sp. HMSC034E08]|uniref:hypothetical protein n=1 Tax=Alloscardovia sp. HMSC034E08 TaxID=1739413 RepID=UPI0008C12C9D|nr:hypothetical protein [Alloscardovia sp. HMSC034E08]OFQ96855.1 hypothetical protein HMPREF2909_00220 [Alloscardovia sp. HMSC034E08]
MGEHVMQDNHASEDLKSYVPVFSARVRTIIYVAGLVASVIGLGFMTFGYADIGGFIATAAGIITGGFGVAYSPLRSNM